MDKPDQPRQVIHLYIIATEEHHYFGSIQALYDHYTREQLGVAAQSLYNKWRNEPYCNDKIILRRGRLIQMKNRIKRDVSDII
jgi:hypothetical protein